MSDMTLLPTGDGFGGEADAAGIGGGTGLIGGGWRDFYFFWITYFS